MTALSTVQTTTEKWAVLGMRFCPVGFVPSLAPRSRNLQHFVGFRSYQNRAVFNNILPTIQNIYTVYIPARKRDTKVTLLARHQAKRDSKVWRLL